MFEIICNLDAVDWLAIAAAFGLGFVVLIGFCSTERK